MASIIRIKRSSVSGNPNTLAAGELAYSALTDNGSNGGDRLYIGIGSETAGNAANHYVIGGKYFTDMLDHTPGTLTASSALIADSSKKINELLVDDLSLNGSTISTTTTNTDLTLSPNGTGKVSIASAYTLPRVDGSNGYVLTTNGSGVASWSAPSASSFTITGDTGSDTFNTGGTLNFSGTDPINTAISDDTVTISVSDATTSTKGVASFNSTDFSVSSGAVSLNSEAIQDIVGAMVTGSQTDLDATYNDGAGTLDFTLNTVNSSVGTYGSSTSIPSITVNAKGLITAVSTSSISSTLSIAADTGTTDSVTIGTDTFTISGGEGIDTAVTNNTITIAGEDASSSNKGIATFNTSGFVVTSGDVALKGNVPQTINGNTGSAVPSSNAVTISGSGAISTSGSSATLTISATDASTSTKGVASFDSGDFSVSSGAVSIKTGGVDNTQLANSSITIGTTSTSLGSTSLTLAGLQQLDVDNIQINGNEISATDTNGGISIKPNGTGHISANSANIQNLANPVLDQDAATKWYVDHVAQGLHVHAPVQVATTGTLASITGGTVTYTSTNGGTLTLQNALTILDSYTLQNTDRILVKDQANTAHNGIYTWATGGTVLTRASDANEAADLAGGDFVFVVHGNTKGDTGWVQTEVVTTLGTDAIVFQQFSGAGVYTAGLGLTLTGTVFDINLATSGGLEITSDELQLKSTVAGAGLTYSNGVIAVGAGTGITVNADDIQISASYVGQSSITTLGTISSGTWNGSLIAGTYGGTGVNNGTKTITLGGNLTTSGSYNTTLTVTADTSVTLPTSGTLVNTSVTTLSSLASIGTITTGTWNGTAIGSGYGGTGFTTYSTGDIIYASASNTLSKRAAGTDGQVLQMNSSGVPVWGDIDGGTY